MEVTEVIFNEILRHSGLPEDVTSDQGLTKNTFCPQLDINGVLSSGYHPPYDGQLTRNSGSSRGHD